MRILTEPKNALLQAVPEVLPCSTTSTCTSPTTRSRPSPTRRSTRGTGARGLRAILEEVLLEVMYDLPSRSRRHAVRGRPLRRARAGAPRRSSPATTRNAAPRSSSARHAPAAEVRCRRAESDGDSVDSADGAAGEADRSTGSRRSGRARWEADGTYRVRPHEDARRDLLDRHAAADGQRLAAHGLGVRVRADRHDRPLPAHARATRSSTRWAGTTTASPPSAGCRTTTACAATRRCRTTPTSRRPRSPAKRRDPDLAAELRRAVRHASSSRTRRSSRSCGAASASRSTGR